MTHDPPGSHAIASQFAKRHLCPVFREAGFARIGLVWRRRHHSVVHLVELQVRRFSQLGEAVLTLNVGVFSEQIWRVYEGGTPPKQPREIDCFPRTRIGVIMNQMKSQTAVDRWWRIRHDDLSASSDEIVHSITNYVLPLLNAIGSVVDICRLVDSIELRLLPADRIQRGVAMYLAGQAMRGEGMVREVGVEAADWKEKVDMVLGRLRGGVSESERLA